MADFRFHQRSASQSLADIARICGIECPTGVDAGRHFMDVASLKTAGQTDVSFLDNRKYLPDLQTSSAGAVCVHPDMAAHVPATAIALVTPSPYRAYAMIAQAFYPRQFTAEISRYARIANSAHIGVGCRIEAGAVIESYAEIGDFCHIGANAVIGRHVVMGNHGIVGANASISHAILGKHVTIYPGARIGQDGFGFAISPTGMTRVPQLGRVVIGDYVEIGANSTIDRGAGPDTEIASHAMLDNLIQIAHNVKIGIGTVMAAQVGISGSTEIGAFTQIGGQAGAAGHLKIGSKARIAAKSGIIGDVPDGAEIAGYPAIAKRDWLRQAATLAKLTKLHGKKKETDNG